MRRSAKILGTPATEAAISILADASRFTPRVGNRLLKRSRDYAQVYNKNKIDEDAVKKTLEMLEIDNLGLEQADRRLLEIIIKKFNGGAGGR